MANELIGLRPRFFFRVTHDEMDAQTKFHRTSMRFGSCAHGIKFGFHIFKRFTPSEIGINILCCDIDGGIR